MTMPFSPCPVGQGTCPDQSYKMLKDIFGGAVESLAMGTDPGLVPASSNILATMFSFFNSGVLVVGALIVSYIAFVGTISTANDGEAMGRNWSLLAAGKAFLTMPRAAIMRVFVLNHLIHHRAHLCVYLRLNDIAVPGMYGPSGDEG